MIKIERVTDGIYDEVNRLSFGPTSADLLDLEEVLKNQFDATQRAVHVITRSLKSSGRMSSHYTNHTWEGEITYGGPSTGIHNPVDYAEYERERDGFHDFFAPLEGLSRAYISAIKKYFEG